MHSNAFSSIILVLKILNTYGQISGNFKDVVEIKVLPELLKIITAENDAKNDLDGNVQVRNTNKNLLKDLNTENRLRNVFKNRILIKRLVPHGYDGAKYEYDTKYNTVYMPLVRVHGARPRLIHNKENNLASNVYTLINALNNHKKHHGYKNLATDTNDKTLYGDFEILDRKPVHPGYQDDELLNPFMLEKSRKVTFSGILNDIRSYVSTLRTQSAVRKLKYAVLDILESPRLNLRTAEDKEEEDENAGWKKWYSLYAEPFKKKNKKKHLLPEYPFWNYWTYQKTIYQDGCKGNLIQHGPYCIQGRTPH